MIENNRIKLLVNKYHENKFSHAFLFVTNNLKKCNMDVKNLIKEISCPLNSYKDKCDKCNICHLIDNKSLPNIIEIEPDGVNIKKGQILELKEKFKTKPLYINNNIYIINQAEKLNSSAANTMLKFLEEPEENIIGFFITANKENLIDTIKSRCQIITANYKSDSNIEMLNLTEEQLNIIKNLAEEYLERIMLQKESGIYINRKIFSGDIKNREFITNFFTYLFYTFNEIIAGKEIDDLVFLQNITLDNLKKINYYIYKILETIPFNVNIDLILDEFAMELEELR